MNANTAHHRIGIDLGGTKTEAIAIDAQGVTLFRKRVRSQGNSYAAVIAGITSLVGEIDAALGMGGSIGVGMPGSVSTRTGLVKNANTTCLNGMPFDADLAKAIGRPVRVANDANCFALSEAIDGAGAEASSVFGVILGTGVGGGIVIDRRLVLGANRNAGEWGHSPLPWPTNDERPGPRCYCGKHGCIETFVSGPGLGADHTRVTGAKQEPPAIAAAAEAGDPDAARTMARYCDRLARSLACVLNVLDPELVVLGGGLSQVPQLYAALPELLASYLFSDGLGTDIVPAMHGDASGVRGAAWLWTTP